MVNNLTSDAEQLTVAFDRKGQLIALVGRVSSDRVKLFLDCKTLAQDAHAPNENDVFTELCSLLYDVPESVRSTDALKAIPSLISAGKTVENRRVAKGQPSEAGVDERLLFLVRKYAGNKNNVKFESVDPTQIRNFDNVEVGTVVARIFEPTPGVPGQDVFGKLIAPKAGQKVKVTFDRTLRIDAPKQDESYKTVIALAEGFLCQEEQKLLVKTVLALNCDVGPRTGNVEFIGGIAVNGSLMNSHRISARGPVKVVRDVLNGSIFSSNGSISILGSATGDLMDAVNEDSNAVSNLKGGIDFRCAGDFNAQMAQGISADIGGNIIITKEASHCWLSCRGALKMEAGHLYSAEVYVAQGIYAKKIGSRSGSATVLHLADGLHGTAEYRDLKERIAQCESVRDILLLHLGPYAANPEKGLKLQGASRTKIAELLNKLNAVQQTLAELVSNREELESKSSVDGVLKVVVSDAFYRGSEIVVSSKRFIPDAELLGKKTIEFDVATQEFLVHDGNAR